MSCVGPIARTVEDLALLFAIIAGPDRYDTDVAPVPVEEMPQLELNRLRIAFAPTGLSGRDGDAGGSRRVRTTAFRPGRGR